MSHRRDGPPPLNPSETHTPYAGRWVHVMHSVGHQPPPPQPVGVSRWHEVPKVSDARSWSYIEDGRSRWRTYEEHHIQLHTAHMGTASNMTTETSGSPIHSSLNKTHVLKVNTMLSFIAWRNPCKTHTLYTTMLLDVMRRVGSPPSIPHRPTHPALSNEYTYHAGIGLHSSTRPIPTHPTLA